MKAWMKRDGRLQLLDVPEPAPAAGDVLVRVEAISLNRGELRTVARAAEGFTPGWDIAGTIVAGPREGTRVAALLNGGGWAEYVALPASRAAVIPDSVDSATAATLPIAGLTVVRALQVAGSLLGKHALITGASGGVGQLAIQLASAAGAFVTAVSSNAAQHDSLRALGADAVVPRIADARGAYDLVLESVGGASLATAIGLVARGGVVVTIGNSSEEATTFNARTLYAKGGATIYGLLIFEELDSGRVGAADLERLMRLVANGTLTSPITVRRDWTELPNVLAELEQCTYSGKAVLTIGGA